MSKIMKRPLFRKGGSTGIMSNVVERQGYSLGDRVEQRQKLLSRFAGPSRSTAIPNFLIQSGLNLIEGTGEDRGLLREIGASVRDPLKTAMASKEREDMFKRQLGLTAATGVLGEMQAEKIAKIKAGSTMSAIARRAKEAVLSGANNPSTGKPFKNYQEAYTYFSLSAKDISRASPAERRDEEEKKIIAGGGSSKYAPAQAKYNVEIRDKIPPIKRGGFFKSKKGSPKKPITGNYYYDLDSEQLYLFDGKQLKVVTDIESIS
tara:strand:- start:101 stop:886 length:786 start_codon:yes stop_codon:yes gene_type:complete